MDESVLETVTLPPDPVAVSPTPSRAAILAELAELNPYTVLNRMRNRIADLNDALSGLPPDSP